MPSGLNSREVVWTATPSDTYRTGKTKLVDGISEGPSSGVPRIATVLPPVYRKRGELRGPERGPLARNPARSQHVRGELGERRTLALRQGDVAGQALVLELVHHVHQAVARRVHVRVVDLVRVAGEDDLRVVPHPGDDG